MTSVTAPTCSVKTAAEPANHADRANPFRWLRQQIEAIAKQRRRRRDLRGIEPRLLCDMGVDPAELYGEFWREEEIQRRGGRRFRPLPWR